MTSKSYVILSKNLLSLNHKYTEFRENLLPLKAPIPREVKGKLIHFRNQTTQIDERKRIPVTGAKIQGD
jgi:hypothetical protein